MSQPRTSHKRLNDREFDEAVFDLQQKLARIDALPESFRDRVYGLLNDLDRMHREVLLRMLDLLAQDAPRSYERLLRDPAVQTLLLLYELSPDLEAGAEKEARDPLIGLEGGNEA